MHGSLDQVTPAMIATACIPRSAMIPVATTAPDEAKRSLTRSAANAAYLLAVLAINFTLFRPSPVDVLFVLALLLSVVSGQIITRNVFLFVSIMLTWIVSLYVSSVSLIDYPDVSYQMVKISFAISIGFSSSLIGAMWRARDFERFFTVYIVATCIASALGAAGYLLDVEDLVWDGRAKGFLDDPNMYGAFLGPGILACMYMLSRGRSRKLYLGALVWIAFGLMLSFSRAAIVSCLVWSTAYYVFIHRKNLTRAGFNAIVAIVLIGLSIGASTLVVDGLGERLTERSTVAKDYDLGHEGRYGRYALSVPYILDHPLGLGLLEWDRRYDEPIHNIWLSSFLNYGWIAGIAFTLLIIFTVAISFFNYRQHRSEIALVVTLSWLAVVSCAFLHEAERWRHLWLFTGLVWGLNAAHLRTPPRPATRASDEASG